MLRKVDEYYLVRQLIFRYFCITLVYVENCGMKKKLRTIIEELGQKANVRRELASDLERLSSRLALHHIHLESASLKKIIGYFKGKEKPSKKIG